MKLYGEIRKIFMVGIGGSGMCGIAEILHNIGYKVRGSDIDVNSETISYLRNLGIEIKEGHSGNNIKEEQVVVFSSAIKYDNPELKEAKKRGLLVLRRAEMLSELMRLKFGIAVSGSHGKTTTTSMLSQILENSKYDPTIVVGGRVKNIGSSAKVGKGDIMVVEADESDGSFLNFVPSVSVITNIDREHLDHYGSFQELQEAFVKFSNSVPFYGVTVLSSDDFYSNCLQDRIIRTIKTFGLGKEAEVRGEITDKNESRFKVFYRSKLKGEINLKTRGEYNIRNALASIAVAEYLNISFKKIKEALEKFEGVSRRFDFKFRGDISIVEDYGHHPTEIVETLKVAQKYEYRRIIEVFQPHRYSRTKMLLKEFPPAFKLADKIILTEIYPAGEDKINRINGRILYEEFVDYGYNDIDYIEKLNDIPEFLSKIVKKGDLVIFQGAGNIRDLIPDFVRRIRNE